jgi:hypothetical protein
MTELTNAAEPVFVNRLSFFSLIYPPILTGCQLSLTLCLSTHSKMRLCTVDIISF